MKHICSLGEMNAFTWNGHGRFLVINVPNNCRMRFFNVLFANGLSKTLSENVLGCASALSGVLAMPRCPAMKVNMFTFALQQLPIRCIFLC